MVIALRPDWDQYFLNIAAVVASRADCTRRQASAVIVKRNRICSTGYNGAPAGHLGCASSNACPRGRLSTAELQSYSSYDTGPGACIAVHAEANALLYANREQTEGATLYTWSSTEAQEPCQGCWRLIQGAGIARVVWTGGEWNNNG
jgi:dCMP deaminase